MGLEYGCSLGFGGRDRLGHAIAITAGHCGPPHPIPAYIDLDARPSGQLIRSSPVGALDYAAIQLRPGQATEDRPIAPPPHIGAAVCKIGRVSGRTCGPITAITATTITARLRVVWGDSGGPLLDRRGHVIGTTSHGNPAGIHSGSSMTPETRFLASMAGALPPIPAVFMRADAIYRELQQAIGFRSAG